MSVNFVWRLAGVLAVLLWGSSCTPVTCTGVSRPVHGASYDDIEAQPRPAAVPGEAVELIIYREDHFADCGDIYPISIAGQPIVGLETGTFTKVYVMPGHYHISSGKNEARDRDFDVEAGSKYFLLFDQENRPTSGVKIEGYALIREEGWVTLHDRWTFVPEEIAKKWVRYIKYLPSTTLLISQ